MWQVGLHFITICTAKTNSSNILILSFVCATKEVKVVEFVPWCDRIINPKGTTIENMHKRMSFQGQAPKCSVSTLPDVRSVNNQIRLRWKNGRYWKRVGQRVRTSIDILIYALEVTVMISTASPRLLQLSSKMWKANSDEKTSCLFNDVRNVTTSQDSVPFC